MVARHVLGTGWSLLVGLTGCYLLVQPWALGLQGANGDWTNASRAVVANGAFLALLGLVGLVATLSDVLPRPRPPRSQPPRSAATPTADQGAAPQPAQMEQLLHVLARALVDDISRRGDGSGQAESERSGSTWRSES